MQPFILPARFNRKIREEKRKHNVIDEPTFYIDRDRAAAVVVGSKDIKSELKVTLIYYRAQLNVIELKELL